VCEVAMMLMHHIIPKHQADIMTDIVIHILPVSCDLRASTYVA
jgi:hypothetical protein